MSNGFKFQDPNFRYRTGPDLDLPGPEHLTSQDIAGEFTTQAKLTKKKEEEEDLRAQVETAMITNMGSIAGSISTNIDTRNTTFRESNEVKDILVNYKFDRPNKADSNKTDTVSIFKLSDTGGFITKRMKIEFSNTFLSEFKKSGGKKLTTWLGNNSGIMDMIVSNPHLFAKPEFYTKTDWTNIIKSIEGGKFKGWKEETIKLINDPYQEGPGLKEKRSKGTVREAELYSENQIIQLENAAIDIKSDEDEMWNLFKEETGTYL